VIRRQAEAARKSLRQLEREGFRHVYVLRTPEEVESATVVRTPLRPNMHRADTGPFDIIGDVHGCIDELLDLLRLLGWQVDGDCPTHPDGRKAVFIGDLIDRGPNSVGVVQLARRMVEAGVAYAVIGNHDEKLIRYLRGRKVQVSHGLERTLQELEAHPEPLRHELRVFLESLPSHLVLDNGKLVVAHAGIKQPYIGRSSPVIRDFCLYGETTGESDEFGLPVRLNWAADYRGSALVVYGHTPNPDPLWQNNTVNIDTGCVFGGALTALRYPERETVSVPAKQVYYAPVRPTFARPELGTPTLRYEDVAGKQYIPTRLHGTILLREDKTAPALETLSRFGVDPRWVIYLPRRWRLWRHPTSLTCWSILTRRSPTIGTWACIRSCASRSIWGRARLRLSVATRASRAGGSASPPRRWAWSTRARAGGSSTTPRGKPRCCSTCATRRRRRDCGTRWRPTGCCWTRS
jgi:protein phosphatase